MTETKNNEFYEDEKTNRDDKKGYNPRFSKATKTNVPPKEKTVGENETPEGKNK